MDMIKIVIVDAHEQTRAFLCGSLKNQGDFDVAGLGSDSYEAVKLVDSLKPDIVLLDIDLPGDGIKAASLIKYRSPSTAIIFHSETNSHQLSRAFFSGFSACLHKEANTELLCNSIRTVVLGGFLITPETAEKVCSTLFGAADAAVVPERVVLPRNISPPELRLMGFISQGMSNREIAGRLGLTEGTVRNYISALLQKMGLHDRTQIAIYAIKHGL